MHAVSFRYMEYWITAPLLFLAVVSLLTVDAPAWYRPSHEHTPSTLTPGRADRLFLSGYWMIQACNAIGIALQGSVSASIMQSKESEPVVNIMTWAKGVVLAGTW